MSTITIVFHLQNKVFRVLDLAIRELTYTAAVEAFSQGCTATVHVDGLRFQEPASSVEQLYNLLGEASSVRGFQCAGCGA